MSLDAPRAVVWERERPLLEVEPLRCLSERWSLSLNGHFRFLVVVVVVVVCVVVVVVVAGVVVVFVVGRGRGVVLEGGPSETWVTKSSLLPWGPTTCRRQLVLGLRWFWVDMRERSHDEPLPARIPRKDSRSFPHWNPWPHCGSTVDP